MSFRKDENHKKKKLLALGLSVSPLLLKWKSIVMIGLVVAVLIAPASAEQIVKGHWKLIDDNTLAPNNESYNVLEGRNGTTTYKHETNGTSLFTDNATFGKKIIITGENIDIGNDNYAGGIQSILLGNQNNNGGFQNMLMGNLNFIYGDYGTSYATCLGSQNVIGANYNADGCIVIGEANNLDGYESVIIGSVNNILGEYSVIIGSNDIINGDDNTIIGSDITYTGSDTFYTNKYTIINNDATLNNNSLLWTNLSSFAGNNIIWNPVTMQFDASASGGNPFNQDLNDSDSPTFDGLESTGNITLHGVNRTISNPEGNLTVDSAENTTIGHAGNSIFLEENTTLDASKSFTWSSYCSVTVDSDGSAGTNVNVFDEDSYASYSYTNNTYSYGIDYYKANGTFIFDNSGVYIVSFSSIAICSSTDEFMTNISKNGVSFYDHQYLLHASVDPAPFSVSLIENFDKGDVLRVYIHSTDGVDSVYIQDGTTLTVNRIA